MEPKYDFELRYLKNQLAYKGDGSFWIFHAPSFEPNLY